MLRSVILVTALALGGCATSATTTTDISSTIAAVQSATVIACKFLPTVSTVANLLTTNSAAQTSEAIAALICQAVSPAAVSSRLRAKLRVTSPTSITVNGVVIHGRFVS